MQTLCRLAARRAAPAAATVMALMVLAVPLGASAAELRGFASEGPAGLLVFQRCQGGAMAATMLKVSDKSRESALTAGVSAVREVMHDASRPVYVEFVGEASGAVVTARRFHRAIGHIESCAQAPRDVEAGTRLLASGEAPSWRFVATPAGGRLQLEGAKPVRFPAAAFNSPASAATTRTFDAWSVHDGGTVRVEVSEGLCREDRTETATGARVALRYGATSVEGCAARF